MLNKFKAHTPNGTNDMLFEETAFKNQVLFEINNIFSSKGYFEVTTPTFEDFNIYSKPNQLIKFIDRDGSVLALRPDITTSIARMVACKLNKEKMPLRIRYSGNAFREEDESVGMRQREFTQIGVELIGVNSAEADAEVISATVKALKAAGLKNFLIEIGNAGFFNGLMEATKLSEEDIQKVKQLIDKKNIGAISKLFDNIEIDEQLKELILNLPYKFGGIEVINEVIKYPLPQNAKNALENIREIYEILEDYKVSEYITIDLGMVQQFDYYTGVIVKGFAKGVGFPICGGGRYDNLIGEFGHSLPATGIAIGVERLLFALNRDECDFEKPTVHTLVVYENKNARKTAFMVADGLRMSGLTVTVNVGEKNNDFADFGGVIKVLDEENLEIINPNDDYVHKTTVSELLGGAE